MIVPVNCCVTALGNNSRLIELFQQSVVGVDNLMVMIFALETCEIWQLLVLKKGPTLIALNI